MSNFKLSLLATAALVVTPALAQGDATQEQDTRAAPAGDRTERDAAGTRPNTVDPSASPLDRSSVNDGFASDEYARDPADVSSTHDDGVPSDIAETPPYTTAPLGGAVATDRDIESGVDAAAAPPEYDPGSVDRPAIDEPAETETGAVVGTPAWDAETPTDTASAMDPNVMYQSVDTSTLTASELNTRQLEVFMASVAEGDQAGAVPDGSSDQAERAVDQDGEQEGDINEFAQDDDQVEVPSYSAPNVYDEANDDSGDRVEDDGYQDDTVEERAGADRDPLDDQERADGVEPLQE